MAYQQYYKGQTFPPGSTFPDHVMFESCTFKATCTFGVGCHFDGCKFQRCCPRPNNNSPSKIKSGIVVNSTLESVSLDANTLGHNNTNTGYMVTDMSWSRAGVTHGAGQSSDRMENCCLGVTISPTDVGTFPPCDVNPSDNIRGIQNESKG